MPKNKIKSRRKELGMTQIEIALAVGVSLTSYQLWERGVMYPKEKNEKKLLKVLKISTIY